MWDLAKWGSVAVFAIAGALPLQKASADSVAVNTQVFGPTFNGSFTGGTLPSGSPVAQYTNVPFTSSGSTYTGSYNFEVFVGANSFGSHDVTFVYNVKNTSTGTADAINRVTLTGYAGFSVNLSDTASTADISSYDRSASGDTIGFTFNGTDGHTTFPGIAPGHTSDTFVIQTNATTYVAGSINFIDGGVTAQPAYAPATAPLPATASTGLALLAGLGVLGGVSVLRRRRQMA